MESEIEERQTIMASRLILTDQAARISPRLLWAKLGPENKHGVNGMISTPWRCVVCLQSVASGSLTHTVSSLDLELFRWSLTGGTGCLFSTAYLFSSRLHIVYYHF